MLQIGFPCPPFLVVSFLPSLGFTQFLVFIFSAIGWWRSLWSSWNQDILFGWDSHILRLCLYLWIQVPGKIHLVLEYCRGGDLSMHIQHHGKVPEETAKYFMQQLGSGTSMLPFPLCIFFAAYNGTNLFFSCFLQQRAFKFFVKIILFIVI